MPVSWASKPPIHCSKLKMSLPFSRSRFLRGDVTAFRLVVTCAGLSLSRRSQAPKSNVHSQDALLLDVYPTFAFCSATIFPLLSILWTPRRTRELSSSGGRRFSSNPHVHWFRRNVTILKYSPLQYWIPATLRSYGTSRARPGRRDGGRYLCALEIGVRTE
jgi:hypothetical protein